MQKLGTITFTQGTVTITDPCYNRGTWCTATVQNVHQGEWTAEIEISDEGDWGKRVKNLVLTADGETGGEEERLPDEIGVDAGVCGVFEDKPNYGDADWFNLCDSDLSDRFGGLAKKDNSFQCVGAWSSSGYGDGGYDAYIRKNEAGEVVAIRVNYL